MNNQGHNLGQQVNIVGLRDKFGRFLKGNKRPLYGVITKKQICIECNKTFNKKVYSKYCSQSCYWIAKKGTQQSEQHRKSISKSLKGKSKSKEHIEKVANANRGKKRPEWCGEKHHNWKGELVGYHAVHDWVRIRIGKPEKCNICSIENKYIKRKNGIIYSTLHLSNISGEYKRNLNDWEYLCPKCHSYKDKNRNSISKEFDNFTRKV